MDQEGLADEEVSNKCKSAEFHCRCPFIYAKFNVRLLERLLVMDDVFIISFVLYRNVSDALNMQEKRQSSFA